MGKQGRPCRRSCSHPADSPLGVGTTGQRHEGGKLDFVDLPMTVSNTLDWLDE